MFTYDTLGRLLTAAESGSDSWSEPFGYDANHNRWIGATTGQPPSNPLFTPRQNVFDPLTNRINRYVDIQGNSTSVSWYDKAGNQTQMGPAGSAGTFQAAYDAEGRQTTVTVAGGAVTTYVYDGLGQRVQKGNVTYVYDAAGNLAAEYGSTLPTPLPCSTCYTTPDALGSTRLVTNDGSYVSRHDFAPFGEEITSTNRLSSMGYGLSDSIAVLYTGKERDSETGLDFFGARYRSPWEGRFTTRDPGSFGADWSQPQTWNGYSYVSNNPTSYVDPFGLQQSISFSDYPGSSGPGWNPSTAAYDWGVSFQVEVAALRQKAALLLAAGQKAAQSAGAPSKSPTCPAGATAAGLTYSSDVRRHIEQRHMRFLPNGQGAPMGFFNRNGVKVPASQYYFDPAGTPDMNFDLVKRINAMIFSVAQPVFSRGNFTFTATLGPQNNPVFGARPYFGIVYRSSFELFGHTLPVIDRQTSEGTLVTKLDCQTVVSSYPGPP